MMPKGTSIDVLKMSDALRADMKARGYVTVDILFGGMIGMPTGFRTWVESFGDDFDAILNEARTLADPRLVAAEHEPPVQYGMGALDPKDKPGA